MGHELTSGNYADMQAGYVSVFSQLQGVHPSATSLTLDRAVWGAFTCDHYIGAADTRKLHESKNEEN